MESTLDNIIRILTGFASLAGVSAAVAVLVSFARHFGLVKTDEQAGKVTAGLNLVAFVVLVIFGVFRPDLSLDFLDSIAAKIATVGLFVLGLITQLVIPAPVLRAFYQARVPVLGAVGERYEVRAHIVRPSIAPEPAENWTTEPKK